VWPSNSLDRCIRTGVFAVSRTRDCEQPLEWQRKISPMRNSGAPSQARMVSMKTNAYRGDFEASMLPYSATDARAPADADLGITNRNLARGDSGSGTVGASVRRPFPLRTLMVCFTIWLIATQAMIFDQVKFDERAQLLEQTARSLGAPQVVVPSERPAHSSTGAEIQRL
jgi:hypothetical protein